MGTAINKIKYLGGQSSSLGYSNSQLFCINIEGGRIACHRMGGKRVIRLTTVLPDTKFISTTVRLDSPMKMTVSLGSAFCFILKDPMHAQIFFLRCHVWMIISLFDL